jgi:chromosomal replication initiator protein
MNSVLDPRLTFDGFVVGPSNRLAAAAARRAAESPGTSYNPLVVYGGPGMGKTHLLNAVGHLARAVRPELRAAYRTVEELVDGVSAALAAGTLDAFRDEYRRIDLLLLDDVQFLGGKGRMISLATETDRTLFFDFLPLELGAISGFQTRFQL